MNNTKSKTMIYAIVAVIVVAVAAAGIYFIIKDDESLTVTLDLGEGFGVDDAPEGWNYTAYSEGIYTKDFPYDTSYDDIIGNIGTVERTGYTFDKFTFTGTTPLTEAVTFTATWTVVGNFVEYSIIGTSVNVDTILEGTVKLTIVEETSDVYEGREEILLYEVGEGSRDLISAESDTIWLDKEAGIFGKPDGVVMDSETIITNYGAKKVDVYLEYDGVDSIKTYVGENGVIYRMVLEMKPELVVMTFELINTNMI